MSGETVRVGTLERIVEQISSSGDGRFDGAPRYYCDTFLGGAVAVDEETWAVLHRFFGRDYPRSLALSHDGAMLYLANTGWVTGDDAEPGTIAVFDVRDVGQPGPGSPSGSLLGQESRAVATAAGEIRAGAHPYDVALSPDDRTLYVTNAGSDTVSVVDTAQAAVVATVPVGSMPLGIAADETAAYVASLREARVYRLNALTHEVTGSWTAGSGPRDLVVEREGPRVYVTSQAARLYVYDRCDMAEIGTVALDQGPSPAATCRARVADATACGSGANRHRAA